jgi:hypothetical protein
MVILGNAMEQVRQTYLELEIPRPVEQPKVTRLECTWYNLLDM